MSIVVLITAKNSREAKKLAKVLVDSKLAACVNIVKGVDSIFRWQGKIDQAQEALLIVKSQKRRLNKIIKTVKLNHSYDVPEIIALPIAGGSDDYLQWLNDQCK